MTRRAQDEERPATSRTQRGSSVGAVFVRTPERSGDFHAECSELVGPILRGWFDEFTGRRNLRCVLLTFEGSDWLRIDGTVPSERLADISEHLGTDILEVHACFEFVLSFQLVLYDRGRIVRKLTQTYERVRTPWTEVIGDEQPWEREVFFAPGDLARCVRRARHPEQLREWQNICAHRSLLPGAQFPWAAELEVLDRLRSALSLPWLDSDFPTKRATVITSSNPDPPRRWWEFW